VPRWLRPVGHNKVSLSTRGQHQNTVSNCKCAWRCAQLHAQIHLLLRTSPKDPPPTSPSKYVYKCPRLQIPAENAQPPFTCLSRITQTVENRAPYVTKIAPLRNLQYHKTADDDQMNFPPSSRRRMMLCLRLSLTRAFILLCWAPGCRFVRIVRDKMQHLFVFGRNPRPKEPDFYYCLKTIAVSWTSLTQQRK
jgi:hypothetical protein